MCDPRTRPSAGAFTRGGPQVLAQGNGAAARHAPAHLLLPPSWLHRQAQDTQRRHAAVQGRACDPAAGGPKWQAAHRAQGADRGQRWLRDAVGAGARGWRAQGARAAAVMTAAAAAAAVRVCLLCNGSWHPWMAC